MVLMGVAAHSEDTQQQLRVSGIPVVETGYCSATEASFDASLRFDDHRDVLTGWWLMQIDTFAAEAVTLLRRSTMASCWTKQDRKLTLSQNRQYAFP